MYIITFILLFWYFGEGAYSVSSFAIICGRIATGIILLPPIIFNLYKIVNLKKKSNQTFITYLIAEFVIVSFFMFAYYRGFIGT